MFSFFLALSVLFFFFSPFFPFFSLLMFARRAHGSLNTEVSLHCVGKNLPLPHPRAQTNQKSRLLFLSPPSHAKRPPLQRLAQCPQHAARWHIFHSRSSASDAFSCRNARLRQSRRLTDVLSRASGAFPTPLPLLCCPKPPRPSARSGSVPGSNRRRPSRKAARSSPAGVRFCDAPRPVQLLAVFSTRLAPRLAEQQSPGQDVGVAG